MMSPRRSPGVFQNPGPLLSSSAEVACDVVVFRYRLHPEPACEYVSPSVGAITGYSAEEHYADPTLGWKIVHADDRPMLEQLLRDPAASYGPVRARWRRKDGRLITTDQWVFPQFDAGGRLVAIEGIARRIRSLPEAGVLADAAELLDSVGEAVVVTDRTRRVVYVNRRAAELFGVDAAALLGQPVQQLMPQETDARTAPVAEQLLAGTLERWSGRVALRHGDAIVPTEATAAPIRDAAGTIVGIATVLREQPEVDLRNRLLIERERTQLLLEAAPVALYVAQVDDVSTTLFVSPNTGDVLGHPPERFREAGDFWLEQVHPDDRERVLAELAAARDAGQGVLEYRFRRADGAYRWMRDEFRAVRGRSHEPLRIVGYMQDIHERRKAAEQLQRFFDLSLDLLCIASTDGRFERVNPAFTEILGWSPDELLSRPFVEFVHPDDREVTLAATRRLADGEPVIAFENRYRCRDGSYRWLFWKSAPDPAGGRIYAAARDITRRKEAEAALEEARRRAEARSQRVAARLEEVFDAAPVGILETSRDGRIQRANPALARMLGYASEAEMRHLQMPTDVYQNPADREVVLQEVTARGMIREREVRWKSRAGQPIWVQLDAVMLTRPDGEVFVEYFIRDVTQRRSLEEQLNQAQKMEAVGRLAGGIAHDFNNLLTAILGNVDLLLFDLPEQDPARRDLEEVAAAARRAAGLTGQLLAFSRKQIIEPVVLDLNEVMESTEKMLRRLLGEDIELHLEHAAHPLLVRADRTQLEQVVMNLAVNARDAMPGGGRLTIETGEVELSDEYAAGHAEVRPGPHALLAVSDTGQGMDAATRLRIFEPFFTTKETGKGTGLGLSTVYGIVRQAGGHIWVYSEPGSGATFKIYLPLVTDAESAERRSASRRTSPSPALRARGDETVLIVEDDDAVRALAVRTLRRYGYRALVAQNGGEAVLLLEEYAGPLHLLLTDVVMPRLGGGGLHERLKKLRPDLKVLFMSGYTDDAIVRHGVLQAGLPFLSKPFGPVDLVRRVREVLDGP